MVLRANVCILTQFKQSYSIFLNNISLSCNKHKKNRKTIFILSHTTDPSFYAIFALYKSSHIKAVKNKKLFFLMCIAPCLWGKGLYAQTELKVNGAYALAGIINISAEVPISPRLSLSGEALYSPWESVKLGGHSRPEKFAYVMSEVRWYFKKTDKELHRGWWLGADLGALIMLKMSRPRFFEDGKMICWFNKYERGAGLMTGLTIGYKWILNPHFTLEVYAGGTFITGWYNGYFLYDVYDDQGNKIHSKDEVMMKPQRPNQPEIDDPWNGSSNWIPRFGVNLAYKFL